MSSSSKPTRARVMRGAANLDMRRAPFEVDLTMSSPLASVDRVRVEQAVSDGYQTGFDAGRAEGYNAGLAGARMDVEAEADLRLSALKAAVDALATATTLT